MKIALKLCLLILVGCKSSYKINQITTSSTDEKVIHAILVKMGTIHKGFWFVGDSTKLPTRARDTYFESGIYKLINKDTFVQIKDELLRENIKRSKIDVNISNINDTNLSKVNTAFVSQIIRSKTENSLSVLKIKYPGFLGSISFSKISYSKDKNFALIYFNWYSGPLASAGDFYLLKKTNSQWIVIYRKNYYVS